MVPAPDSAAQLVDPLWAQVVRAVRARAVSVLGAVAGLGLAAAAASKGLAHLAAADHQASVGVDFGLRDRVVPELVVRAREGARCLPDPIRPQGRRCRLAAMKRIRAAD